MNAYLLSLNPDASLSKQWDFGLLSDFLLGKLWSPSGFSPFKLTPTVSPTKTNRAIVAIPARHNVEYVDGINHHLNKIDHVVLFLMGDEEAEFPVERIEHPSIHIWVQNPHPGRHDDYNRLGTGYPLNSTELIVKRKRAIDVFFSGQLTHPRRNYLWNALNHYEKENPNRSVYLRATDGFTKGYPPSEYFELMSMAKVIPCPSGAIIPDSFRLFEALETGCIPIADDKNSQETIESYWNWLFDQETPFPKYGSVDRVEGLIDQELSKWPKNQHEVWSWWQNWKRDFAYKVWEQLNG